jgi:hypothetical protein
MEAKWPFLLLILFFVGFTGYLISQLERSKVTRNWDKRRCDFTVMLAARFFKPPQDPRTPGAFSSDNFDFCVKKHSDQFLSLLMAPISWLMSKQVNLTGSAMSIMNVVRDIMNRVTSAFTSYLSSYTKKLSASMYELRRIVIYLRQAVQRMMAVAVSTIYMGMTLFRAMISSFQVIIRVILIICAIMIAVIILLWFILLPIIPFIMTTLTAVVAIVGAFSMVMSTSLAAQAENRKGGFCFAETTPVHVQRATESMTIPIREVKIGDRLEDGSVVTMIMEVVSDMVEWYDMEGIQVAGDHRVLGENGWCLVREDPRAHPISSSESPRVFCLNTTSHVIPIRGQQGTLYSFRDWEEFDEEDTEGHRRWREGVIRVLHPNDPIHEEDVAEEQPLSWMAPSVEVATGSGWKALSDIQIGEWIIGPAGLQRILGKAWGLPSHGLPSSSPSPSPSSWIQGGYVWNFTLQRWKPWKTNDQPPQGAIGWNLITDTGEWTARTSTGVYRFRDATEVGHRALPTLYSIVADRLCASPALHSRRCQ